MRRVSLRAALSVLAAVAALGCAALALAQVEVEIGGPVDQADILLEVDRVMAGVVAVRGLEPKEPIPAGLHTRESLRELLLAKLAEEVAPERLAAEARLLTELGVLDPDVDYYALMVEVLTTQIAGFYDEDTQELFLLDDLPAEVQAPTLAHELFHGIQDQLFGIAEIRPDWPEADDAMLAGTALIEGDAVAIMIDYSFGGALSFTDIPNFMSLLHDQLDGVAGVAAVDDVPVPAYLQQELLFPYVGGLAFVHYLKSAGGWAAVDRAYVDPPLSSEQILHPERYLERDDPTWVELDLGPLEAAGYSRAYDSVFGEFRWRSLLRNGLGEVLAERSIDNATAGWDGDRLVSLDGPDGAFALVVLTVWDTPRDAREFEAVLARFVEDLEGHELSEGRASEHGASRQLETDGGLIVIERWGDMVLWIMGAPDELGDLEAEDWADVVWRGRARAPYTRPVPPPEDEAED